MPGLNSTSEGKSRDNPFLFYERPSITNVMKDWFRTFFRKRQLYPSKTLLRCHRICNSPEFCLAPACDFFCLTAQPGIEKKLYIFLDSMSNW